MFIFVIMLLVVTPPALAVRLEVPVLRQYTIQSGAIYQSESECYEAIKEVLTYTEEQRPMYTFKAEAECYKSVVSQAKSYTSHPTEGLVQW